MTSTFADHFSAPADAYSRYRPTYPEELFDYLTSIAPAQNLAWDSAAGSGQAAAGLAGRFKLILATDASTAQVARRRTNRRIEYSVALSEAAPLAAGSVDLTVIAQALHWFDTDRFFLEVQRVSRPGAVCAAWCYGLARFDSTIDDVIDRLYDEVLSGYWPPERVHVEQGYRAIRIPFSRVEVPQFHMKHDWNLEQLTGYLDSWSAVKRYRDGKSRDPIDRVRKDLASAWGDPTRVRNTRWPLHLRAGRVGAIQLR